MTRKFPLPNTEQQNEKTLHLDECDTLEMLTLINNEDMLVPLAVQKELHFIGLAADAAYKKLSSGGRMIYVGAGTSGRLGVLDASECPPTYGTPPEMVQGLIAGGDIALRFAVEGCEDDAEAGAALMDENNVTEKDIVVGITASGGAPYVLGAVKRARQLGAVTVALASNKGCELEKLCDICIVPDVGPEVVAGSTRMKSGTSQKLVLNMLSTSVMIRLGKVYNNLMVDMSASNKKLHLRAARMVCLVTGLGEKEAAELLKSANMDVKQAIMMSKTGLNFEDAQKKLEENNGHLKAAINSACVTR